MKIIFLTIVPIDDINQQGIYTDLLRQFRDSGHNVFSVSPLERRLGLKTRCETNGGITQLFVRVGNLTKVSNPFEKGLSTVTIEKFYSYWIDKFFNSVKFDLILYSTPPITFASVIAKLKKKHPARSYLLLKDIFPQNALDLGILSRFNPAYWFFRFKEKQLYKVSDFIGCMSEANVDFVLKNNPEVSKKKVEVCPNSIKPSLNRLSDKDIFGIKEKFGLPHDKTLLVYGGNLGKPQGIDFLIQCLEANLDNRKVFFIIAGSGTELGKIEAFMERQKPKNVKFFNILPRNEFEQIVSCCDVGLIFLDKRFTIPNFPSRLLSYMHASIPVLAATDKSTDIGKTICEGQFGCWGESGDLKRFNENLLLLTETLQRERMGKNARQFLESHYTVKHSYNVIMRHFEGKKNV